MIKALLITLALLALSVVAVHAEDITIKLHTAKTVITVQGPKQDAFCTASDLLTKDTEITEMDLPAGTYKSCLFPTTGSVTINPPIFTYPEGGGMVVPTPNLPGGTGMTLTPNLGTWRSLPDGTLQHKDDVAPGTIKHQ